MTYVWSLLPVLAIGFIFLVLASPRPGILFSTAVPPGFASSANGRRILRGYRVWSRTVFAGFLALCMILIHRGLTKFVPLVLPAELAIWIALYYSSVRQTRPFAARRGSLRTKDLPLTHVVLGMLATLLPLVAAAIILHRHWLQIPPLFPIHWGIDDQANGWSHRTIVRVYLPIWIGASLIGMMLLIVISTRYARRLRRFSRSTLLLASAFVGFAFAWIGLLPLRPTRITNISIGAVEFLFILALIFWSHQARLAESVEPYKGTPDKYWYGGMFYYNPRDPSIWVPKRFGFGFSLNFARPTSWLLLVFVLLPLGFFLLHHHHVR